MDDDDLSSCWVFSLPLVIATTATTVTADTPRRSSGRTTKTPSRYGVKEEEEEDEDEKAQKTENTNLLPLIYRDITYVPR
jgi:hypothetical protein